MEFAAFQYSSFSLILFYSLAHFMEQLTWFEIQLKIVNQTVVYCTFTFTSFYFCKNSNALNILQIGRKMKTLASTCQ